MAGPVLGSGDLSVNEVDQKPWLSGGVDVLVEEVSAAKENSAGRVLGILAGGPGFVQRAAMGRGEPAEKPVLEQRPREHQGAKLEAFREGGCSRLWEQRVPRPWGGNGQVCYRNSREAGVG